MNRIFKNKSGFTVVEAILIIVAIGVLVGVGYVVYERRTAQAPATLNNTKDAQATEKSLHKESEDLNKELNEDTAKLDEVTQDVQ